MLGRGQSFPIDRENRVQGTFQKRQRCGHTCQFAEEPSSGTANLPQVASNSAVAPHAHPF
jgi:hypothetical protein